MAISLNACAAGGYTIGTFPVQDNNSTAGGYSIGTSPLPENHTIKGDATNTISFWQLPLWIQISCISAVLIALLGAIKIVPIIFGKIQEIANNRNRERIYDYIRTHPGSTVRDISRYENMNPGTVKYHVNRLQVTHKITFLRLDKFLRYFQNSGKYNDREKNVISAIASPACKSIINYLQENPGATNKQIADHLGMTESGAHSHMDRLINDKIVIFKKDSIFKKYYLTDDVLGILEKFPK